MERIVNLPAVAGQPGEEFTEAEPEHASEAQIEAYLDRLCGELKTLPPSRRDDIRREVQQHLQMLTARQEATGLEAVRAALAQFGEPQQVGQAMRRQARRDNWRRWWRGPSRWNQRLSLLEFLAAFATSTYASIEFCHLMEWGHSLWVWAFIGPLLPLCLGMLWGLRADNSRWGYSVVTLVALVILSFLPIPGYPFLFLDLRSFTYASGLVFTVSVLVTYVLLWIWVSCSVCGLTRIFMQASRGEGSEEKAIVS